MNILEIIGVTALIILVIYIFILFLQLRIVIEIIKEKFPKEYETELKK